MLWFQDILAEKILTNFYMFIFKDVHGLSLIFASTQRNVDKDYYLLQYILYSILLLISDENLEHAGDFIENKKNII